jgi:hypothetical protein
VALTSDNHHLSRPINVADEHEIGPVAVPAKSHVNDSCCAIDCTHELTASVQGLVEAGIAPATRRAYRSDLDHFAKWGGVIPSTDAQLASYIAVHATTPAVANSRPAAGCDLGRP